MTDEHNLLRVSCRLTHAPVAYGIKHPIILPRKAVFTRLIVTSVHLRRLHAGPSLTHAYLRLTYWVVGGLATVKSVLRGCVTCARYRAQVTTQLMGPLPPCRVWPNPAFSVCGVDFCGPFLVRPFKSKRFPLFKAYIALFVCMSTKAIHLELVSGLYSADFINALQRFSARRGLCRIIYSDHGTNFVGANHELRAILKVAVSQAEEYIQRQLSKDGIEWRFNPVESPHFGGIWESNIKSVKRHLVKVSSTQSWTVEQLTTILCNIEACLNSRPLMPLSNSPDDLEALTPAHFLIGRSLATVPMPQEAITNPIQNYRLLAAHVQNFWRRWQSEYLGSLLSRPKWRLRRTSVRVGDMVIVREKTLPPSQWRLGRVLGVLPGRDDLNRVITIRTKEGWIKRAIRNVIVLFNEDEV